MREALIVELLIALIISFIIYKFFLRPKESNRGILHQVEPEKAKNISNDDINGKIKLLIKRGYKIEAIKLVRQLSGKGLKEAKEFVESLERGENPSINITEPGAIKLEDSIDQEVLTLLKEGKKIEAIKLVRLKTNAGLKEAKDYIDSLE